LIAKKRLRIPIEQPAINANKGIYTAYFDKRYAQSVAEDILGPIIDVYFRAEFIGFNKKPERINGSPQIYASNHSGMAFPWDGIVFKAGIWRHFNKNLNHSVRTLTAPALSHFHLMNLYLVPDFWKKVGAVDANFLNFETMMQYPEGHVCIYPEGIPGIAKGFNKRYQLQKFSTSAIRMALKSGSDIVPVSVINGEYINPFSYSVSWVNKIAQVLGLPFFPVGITTPLIIFFPWIFYFAFPCNLKYVRGKSIQLRNWIKKPYNTLTDEEIEDLRDKVQIQMQFELNAARKIHGRSPFKIWDWVKTGFRQIKQFPYHIPIFWPTIFQYHDKWHQKNPTGTFKKPKGILGLFKMLLATPFSIFFFLPVIGWLPILYRGYKQRLFKKAKLKLSVDPLSS